MGVLPWQLKPGQNSSVREETRPVPEATPGTLLHDQDRIAVLIPIVGDERRELTFEDMRIKALMEHIVAPETVHPNE